MNAVWWWSGLLLWLASFVFGLTRPNAHPHTRRGLPWGGGIPTPVPAASIGPVNWSSLSPSIYTPQVYVRQGTAPTSLKTATTASSSRITPAVVDWRNRSGVSYITTAQNQGVCQSCWAFAVAALIEAQVRIEHGIWTKRSEADVHDRLGASCESVGNAEETLAFVSGQGADFVNLTNPVPPGIADWPCDPYEATLHGYFPCNDRSGRTTNIPWYQALGLVEDQKRWIHEYGPLIATFELYEDFKPTSDGGAYVWDGKSARAGNHIALVAGYDDEKKAWLVKNSWGSIWGDKGFIWVAYGTGNIDNWTKYGITNVNPDPWAKQRHQSGNMMQSGNGKTHRNFELLLAAVNNNTSETSLTHISRDGTTSNWSIVNEIAKGENYTRLRGQPAVIGTSFNRDFPLCRTWDLVSTIAEQEIDGYPGLVQSDDSNLVLVVKHSDGSLDEWQKGPESSTWNFKSTIANSSSNPIAQSGPSLVKSNVNLDIYDTTSTSHGNLYVVAVLADGTMQLFWRTGTPTSQWTPGDVFGSNIPADTPPVMIQDFFSTPNESSIGGFQLVAAVNGSVQHWIRDNGDILSEPPLVEGRGRWVMVYDAVGTRIKHVWSLVQGSFYGKMHMITEGDDGRFSYWEWDGKWELVEVLLDVGDELWPRSVTVNGG
ncbi:protease [Bombardia bombarda]|uniref:Protease n=1 Tax=Bombardia bombarda TaxID=252184 RepID=A0AA39TLR7_9PEZI|nr:protease [Bombardia bombarda]